ncbi:hypothetical protein V1517DRAFT_277168 [Lipomyces orientalis]|uniref:Uncharacterized protein n=1 Tax=Lipomyces orientalis TaxID=1233043 RepID=A0ACC3TL25_9ASCO
MWTFLNSGRHHATRLTVLLIIIIIFVAAMSYSAVSYPLTHSASIVAPSEVDRPIDLLSGEHQAALAKHARNASLGFGDIVYISMPERTDRQDAMTLLASFTGISLKLMPGVDGTVVPPKAIPDGAPKDIPPSVLGCFRAHANAWQYLLQTDMDTLLIFEDDLDWDPNIKDTMERLSLQMQNSKIRLQPPSDYERMNAPYGLDWDVLYVGSHKHGGNPDLKDSAQAWDDPDVPGLKGVGGMGKGGILYALRLAGLSDFDIEKKRMLTPSYTTEKNTAYAITRQGAARLLFLLSYIGDLKAGDVDQDMTRLFIEGRLKGYTLTPPAFSQFKVGGSKDSDNIKVGKTVNGKGNVKGYSPYLKGSARRLIVDSLKLDNWNDYKKVTGTVTTY